MRKNCIALLGVLLCLAPLAAEPVIIDVPFSKQVRYYECGQNAFRMLLGYWGVDVSREKILDHTGRRGTFLSQYRTIVTASYPELRWQSVSATFGRIKEQIDLGRPLVVSMNPSRLKYLPYDMTVALLSRAVNHAIVVVGYDAARQLVYLRDPNSYKLHTLAAWSFYGEQAYVLWREDKPARTQEEVRRINIRRGTEGWGPVGALLDILPPFMVNLHLGFPGDRDNTAFAETLWSLDLPGFVFGHMAQEIHPLLGNDRIYSGVSGGIGLAFMNRGMVPVPSRGIFTPGTSLSGRLLSQDLQPMNLNFFPRIYHKKAVIFDINFNSGKFHLGGDPAFRSYFTLQETTGGRISLRAGTKIGEFAVGIDYTKLTLLIQATAAEVQPLAFDGRLGPWFGSFMRLSESVAGGTWESTAFSAGIDMGLYGIRTPGAKKLLGLSSAIIRYSHEKNTFTTGGTDILTESTTIKAEFPLSFSSVDLIYSYQYRKSTASLNAAPTVDETGHSLHLQLIFKMLDDYFTRISVGYRAEYLDTLAASGKINHEVSFNLFVGLSDLARLAQATLPLGRTAREPFMAIFMNPTQIINDIYNPSLQFRLSDKLVLPLGIGYTKWTVSEFMALSAGVRYFFDKSWNNFYVGASLNDAVRFRDGQDTEHRLGLGLEVGYMLPRELLEKYLGLRSWTIDFGMGLYFTSDNSSFVVYNGTRDIGETLAFSVWLNFGFFL